MVFLCRLPCYEIKENTIIVKCTVGNNKIALRCKIWPTPKNFGLNKVEATLNGAFLWKKGLWWYNAKSRRDFYIDDDVKLTAEWHVALRTSKYWLAPNDPRRSQGPFCVEYLALRDENGQPLIQYHGDKEKLPEPNVCKLNPFALNLADDFVDELLTFCFHWNSYLLRMFLLKGQVPWEGGDGNQFFFFLCLRTLRVNCTASPVNYYGVCLFVCWFLYFLKDFPWWITSALESRVLVLERGHLFWIAGKACAHINT